jgi:hypothetical protein
MAAKDRILTLALLLVLSNFRPIANLLGFIMHLLLPKAEIKTSIMARWR